MTDIFNIYCDESCHLENDGIEVMILGSIWLPLSKVKSISTDLKQIKRDHGLDSNFEIKWIKVSPAKTEFYLNVLDYFFDNLDLNFRGIIVPNKSLLNHNFFNQDHDTFYNKIYYTMLKTLFNLSNKYRVYIDIKDTHSTQKASKLQEILSSSIRDVNKDCIERVQPIRSEESNLLQLVDLIIGAISYSHRGLSRNAGKVALVDNLKIKSGFSLTQSSPVREQKFNLFVWSPQDVN